MRFLLAASAAFLLSGCLALNPKPPAVEAKPAAPVVCEQGTASDWTNSFAARGIIPEVITDRIIMLRIVAIYDRIPPASKTTVDRVLVFPVRGVSGFVLFVLRECIVGQAFIPYTKLLAAHQQAGFEV